VQGTLNQKPVESAQGSFSYSNARLNFGSNVMVSGPDPLQSPAVCLPAAFAAVKPDSDQIRLDVNVQNEGLALLNLDQPSGVEGWSGASASPGDSRTASGKRNCYG